MLGLGAGMLPLLGLARTPQRAAREAAARLRRRPRRRRACSRPSSRSSASRSGWIVLAVVAARLAGAGPAPRSSGAPWEPRPGRCRRRCRRSRVLAVAVAFLVVGGRPLRRQAAPRDGRLDALGRRARGPSTTSATRSRRSSRARSTRRSSYPLWLPALEARRLPLHGRVRRDARPPPAARASRSRSSAAGGCSCAGTARPFLLAATLLAIVTAPSVLQPAPDELRRHPARDADRARRRRARGVAANRRARAAPGRGALPRRRRADEERGRAVRARRARGRARSSRAARSCARSSLAAAAVLAIDLPVAASGSQVHHVKIEELLALEPPRPRLSPRAQRPRRPGDHASSLFQIRRSARAGATSCCCSLRRPRRRARPRAGSASPRSRPPGSLLSFAGLVAIYWISTNPLTNHLYNSSDRTIACQDPR